MAWLRVDKSPLSLSFISFCNEAVRGVAGIRAEDMRALAERFGVSVRTVQRWFTLAGERRNLIPLSASGRYLRDLPLSWQGRVLLAAALLGEHTRCGGQAERVKVWEEHWFTLEGIVEYAFALHGGLINPFLVCVWRRHTAMVWAEGGEQVGWRSVVEYEGSEREKARLYADGWLPRRERGGEFPEPAEGGGGCEGDDFSGWDGTDIGDEQSGCKGFSD
jgi:hypothetical protein